MWRSELRAFMNNRPIFPDAAEPVPRKADGFVVTSLALAF
jgi:hypothetical protein